MVEGGVELILRYVPYPLLQRLRGAWRWRWPMLATAWAVALLGWLVVALMPDQYQAATRIYVDTDNLLTPLLRNITVDTDLQNRLDVMQRTLLSRGNIAQVVKTAGLEAEARGALEIERQYQRLQEKIAVKAEGRNLFSVTYRHRDPEVARKVVASLLDIFVETNVGHSRANMDDARTFIDSQIGEYEQKLKDAEHRLADYKTRHVDVLAATGTSFSARLDSARDERDAAQAKVREAAVTRDQLRAGLGRVPQFLDVDSPMPLVIGGANSAVSPAVRVRQLEVQLAQLQAQYTDRYPDVVATRRALEAARSDLAQPAANAATPSRGRAANVVYDQLSLRLVQAEADLAAAESRFSRAEETVKRLSALAQVAPRVEADLADLNREYGVLKTKYEDLLGRRESARISAAVETSGDKVHFRIIEPPYVPLTPAWPMRPLLSSAVLLLAVAAAAAVGFGLVQVDDSVGAAEAVAAEFGIRVVASVPRMPSESGDAALRVETRRLAAAATGLLAAYVAVLAWQSLVSHG